MIRVACLALALATGLAGPAPAQGPVPRITSVAFAEPTGDYGHHPMGATVADHRALVLVLDDGTRREIRLPRDRVFEDNTPRLADIDGDGAPEVVVVEADFTRGARLAVYGPGGLRAASPFIGRRNRWMAVAAIADLDGDGVTEIAVVDRPHLRKVLVVWRQEGARLVPIAELGDVTNHRFGTPLIQGGLRNCGAGPEVVLARGDWSGLVAVRMTETGLSARDLGPGAAAADFDAARACER